MDLGIMRRGSGQEHMSGRVVVPVRDESELVVGTYGRTIHSKLHTEVTPKHKYLAGPQRGVLNWKTLVEHKEVILCEAPLDAMTFWTAGYRNVTSSWGTSGFTGEHFEAFRRHGVRRVLLAFDRDEAGDRGAAQVAEKLLAAKVECFRVLFPRGLDANAYARKLQPAEKSLGLALRQAQWMGKGKAPSQATVVVAEPLATPTSGAASTELEAVEPAEATAVAEEALASTAEAKAKGASTSLPEPPATLGELEARSVAQEKLSSLLVASSESEPAASPAPPAPECDVPCEVQGEEVVLWLGDRRYRVRGLQKNLSPELLKANLLVSRGDAFHVDTLDLYSARQRLPFVKQAAEELEVAEEVVRHDLKRVLLRLELVQREALEAELRTAETSPEMTEEERESALELARDPHLVERILADFRRCGVVGEETNKLIGYLATVSRWDERPLAILVQSSSAAGKSALVEALLALLPDEARVSYSAMTGQSLFYMGEKDLRHKVLAIAEEEGAERASYALKLLQSEGKLAIASTGKDPQTGRLTTHEYHVEGPVAILLTTTSVELDEELLNRCIVLTVDESREQTQAIHALQREEETLEGYWAREERKAILAQHQNLQRLLRPRVVVNPRARELRFQDSQTRTRRDHRKYLTLIRAIALLHQFQRPIRRESHGGREVEVLEVEPQDIELANRLTHEVLGRSLEELAPQTRRLLETLHTKLREECEELGIEVSARRFLLREARAWTGFGQTQLKVHVARLVDLEYVVVHRGGRGQSFLYEMVYAGEGAEGARFVPGLLRDETQRSTGKRSGSKTERSELGASRSGSNRGRIGPESGGGRDGDFSSKLSDSNLLPALQSREPRTSRSRDQPGNGRPPSPSR